MFALAGSTAIGLEHDRNFGFDHLEKSFGGTAQAAIGAVLVLLGVKWFDHVLLAGPRAGQYLRDVQSTGKTGRQDILRASCIESARLDLPIGAVGDVRPGITGLVGRRFGSRLGRHCPTISTTCAVSAKTGRVSLRSKRLSPTSWEGGHGLRAIVR